ncbi:MAG TPA: bifunctional DNA-binding transcriptional regulator/O6-methylguanine-DNA methyltransferase Ada [Burkholderiaceae bacterium]|nr:bifunctional DNA-binding transcriptional regulator/O6-methylguanine-DNA methyltransferase Ada [Burkholderiaceae bacterium]
MFTMTDKPIVSAPRANAVCTVTPAPASAVAAPTARSATDDARWQAVVERDRAADGAFVYSVRTTGVYCRPSCPSRRARRDNVAFHADGAAARQAGFRACLRCAPDGPAVDHQRAERIAALCRHIDAAEQPPSLDELARLAGMSPFHLHRQFKAVTGLTPAAYAKARRAQRVRERLPAAATVTEAIYDAGFNSNAAFYERSGDMLGMTPSRYRAGGAGTEIRFAVGQCSLGAILVAATDVGVCAITLGDEPQPLIDELRQRFPKARLVGGDARFERWVAAVVGLVEQPGSNLELPLDVRGTAFQQRVWQALREVPAGRTARYTEIARRIGAPSAVRAVAQACASNNLAVAIPCHRVVRADGDLSGYRWGVARKRSLLEREGAEAARPR